jgi:hypothetical protein
VNVTNIGLAIIVPKIRISMESACFNLFFERNIKPIVTGSNAIIKNKSNLNCAIITWNPKINLLELTSITSGYTVSPKKIIAIAADTIMTYEISIAIFVLLDTCDLYVVNRVNKKNGATYAFV